MSRKKLTESSSAEIGHHRTSDNQVTTTLSKRQVRQFAGLGSLQQPRSFNYVVFDKMLRRFPPTYANWASFFTNLQPQPALRKKRRDVCLTGRLCPSIHLGCFNSTNFRLMDKNALLAARWCPNNRFDKRKRAAVFYLATTIPV